MPMFYMRCKVHVLFGNVFDEPVLSDFQCAVRQVLAWSENLKLIPQKLKILEERVVEPFVSFQARKFMLTHQRLFGLKVPFGVIPEKRDGLFDAVFTFAVEDLVIQSMRCLKEPVVLFVNLCDAGEVFVRPFSNHVTPDLSWFQRAQAGCWKDGACRRWLRSAMKDLQCAIIPGVSHVWNTCDLCRLSVGRHQVLSG